MVGWLLYELAAHGTTQPAVIAWGYGPDGETNVPPGLTNVAAISGGGIHSLALTGLGGGGS